MSRTNYDANYSTFNAYPLSHLMNIEVGPGNDNWLAQYVTHLLRNDEELGPKFQLSSLADWFFSTTRI